jgi:hypothetical protein
VTGDRSRRLRRQRDDHSPRVAAWR